MITNYIKIALRNFYRNKSITFIKILGLALGLAVTLFILIYVSTETSYNDDYKNKNRIVRVCQNNKIHGWHTANTPFPMRDGLLDNFPEVEKATRYMIINDFIFNKHGEEFTGNKMLGVDENFFEIFSIQKVKGDVSSFISGNNIVVTESAANRYFGSTDIINESVETKIGEKDVVLNIIAVIKDFPSASTIQADIISNSDIGLELVNKRMMWSDGKERDSDIYRNDWSTNFVQTYAIFNKVENKINFDDKLRVLEAKYLEDTTERDYYIQDLDDIYLHSDGMYGNEEVGDLKSIYIFSLVAFLVLVIASINYIILSISQMLARKKEVGIRKIVGARSRDLFKQIVIESLLVLIVTLPLALILIEQLRPFLENIIQKEIKFIYNYKIILGFLSIMLFVVFIPGVNIIFYLNRISPLSIFRKDVQGQARGLGKKSILIILQFIIFIVLVVLALGIKRQIDYSMHSNLGFNPENKITVFVKDLVQNGKYETLKAELLNDPDIANVSGAMWLPPSNSRMSVSYSDSNFTEPLKIEALFVDPDFIETFDIKLIKGKSLSEFKANPDWKIVVNESLAEILGNDVIGKEVWNGETVGIISDFRFHSVHEEIQPMMLVTGNYMINEMIVSYNSPISDKYIVELKEQIKQVDEFFDAEPKFLSDRFDELYEKENRLVVLISVFSFLAIFIASIGLLGITIFTTKKQTKNIAIRKVNGATTAIIWRFLIKDYIQLILIAFVIAVPVAYFLLNKWLQDFAYKAPIDWWIFIVAGILALLISLLTISWYSLKAARKNPVESLRYE
ncbi:MAG: ABC transporter permease [Bacteroidetes bacterium]|nr:ABC transporter permease [Bacteroidota bacterium]